MDAVKKALNDLVDDREIPADQQARIAHQLQQATNLQVYPKSVALSEKELFAMGRGDSGRRLVVVAEAGGLVAFERLRESGRSVTIDGQTLEIAVLELSHQAADRLRQALPWTSPKCIGLKTSAGLGDRLGLATPGHIAAIRNTGCAAFLAQQSIREMTRTQRTATEVMDDACWGVFQAGYMDGFGSDADHLKTPADIDTTESVGFTMFTIDPGDHVNSAADSMTEHDLQEAFDALPWSELETTPEELRRKYADESFSLDGGDSIAISPEAFARAMVKYGKAIAHTTRMFRHLADRRSNSPFELEVSVDETDTPTTEAEHFLIAAQLNRLGVKWVSLAPRFIGEFEKGIDYKGDLAAFEKSYAQHAAIARTLGPYKLSLHSGSDKFSIYPIAAKHSEGLVHLKTAGTSYLEALRVAARHEPALFRRILDFAFERFDEDRASYHISAQIDRVPRADTLGNHELESVLDGNDGRQLLHVTFGSVLTARGEKDGYRFRNELLAVLDAHENDHYRVLEKHLGRHVQPFAFQA